MAGITRFKITDNYNGRGRWRFEKSEARWPLANEIYKQIFNDLGMPIENGDKIIECTKKEFEAGYDIELGIDILFSFLGGGQATMQEKILFTDYYTVTVEYYQDWRIEEEGDWFNLKCQYYSTLYDTNEDFHIDDGVILNWPQTQLATLQRRIKWYDNRNKKDGARASFKYAYFDKLPHDVVVARINNKPSQLSFFAHSIA
jgi:hypothetical protein